MKTKYGKRILIIGFSVLLIAAAVSGFAGCSKSLETCGDFVCYKSSALFKKDEITIVGLSDSAKDKEIIEVPETLDGGTVVSLKVKGTGKNYWKSENLKKIFLPFGSNDYIDEQIFEGCPNLEKIILYRSHETGIKISNKNNSDLKVYISGRNYDKGKYGGSNLYKAGGAGYADICFANVAFMYNYSNAPDGGYYFIDDCGYGGLVRRPDNAPPRPQLRTFNGWYRTEGGSSYNDDRRAWDFDRETLPEAYIENGVIQYKETKLYAGWKALL